jgi:hypothetical protein
MVFMSVFQQTLQLQYSTGKDMIDKLQQVNEHTKHLIDWASIMTVIGTLASILPAIAAIWSIVWSTIRIYETKTVQEWIKKKNAK